MGRIYYASTMAIAIMMVASTNAQGRDGCLNPRVFATMHDVQNGCVDVDGSFQTANLFKAIEKAVRDTGKTIEKAAQDTGKTFEKAVQDTGKTIEKAAHDAGKTIEKAAQDTGTALEKAAHDSGNALDQTGQEIADFGRNFDRERLKGTENVFRELKTGYCRLLEGRSPEAGNDTDQNGLDDDYEECMADDSNFSVTVSGDFDGNISEIQVPVAGQEVSIGVPTEEDIKKDAADRVAEQKYIEAFNASITSKFQPVSDLPADFFADPEKFKLQAQGTTTALILNQKPDGSPYTDLAGNKYNSKNAYLRFLAEDRIADLEAMIADLDNFDLSLGRLQLSEAVLAFRGSFELTVDMLSGLMSGAQKAGIVAIGAAEDLINGNDVTLNMVARIGQVPFFDTFMTFTALSVIESNHRGARSEKARVKKKLQGEINLLKLRVKELKAVETTN
ncbi:MAG: hypothetical protein AAGA12_09760 [Pseudomonadota bacterium]